MLVTFYINSQGKTETKIKPINKVPKSLFFVFNFSDLLYIRCFFCKQKKGDGVFFCFILHKKKGRQRNPKFLIY